MIKIKCFIYSENLKNYEFALDGLHPGIKGHEVFANIVYEELC